MRDDASEICRRPLCRIRSCRSAGYNRALAAGRQQVSRRRCQLCRSAGTTAACSATSSRRRSMRHVHKVEAGASGEPSAPTDSSPATRAPAATAPHCSWCGHRQCPAPAEPHRKPRRTAGAAISSMRFHTKIPSKSGCTRPESRSSPGLSNPIPSRQQLCRSHKTCHARTLMPEFPHRSLAHARRRCLRRQTAWWGWDDGVGSGRCRGRLGGPPVMIRGGSWRVFR